MTRTRTLLLIAFLLSVLAVAVALTQRPERIAETADDRQFAYPELDDIARIFIADRQNHRVELTRGGPTGWLVDGEHPANENVMKNLLTTVAGLDIQRLPAYAAVPKMVDNLATKGILVQLFDADGDKLRGYYIGSGDSEETGTTAIVEGAENPYFVHLPNFTGNVRYRFNLWDDEWRSKVVLRADPATVTRLQIEYPTNRSASFRLERNESDYVVSPLTVSNLPDIHVPRGVAEGVLARFEKYYVNRYENRDEASIAAARNTLPYARIEVVTEGENEPQALEIYPRYRNEMVATKNGQREIADVEAYTAFVNNGDDWALLSPNTTEPLFVTYGSFQ